LDEKVNSDYVLNATSLSGGAANISVKGYDETKSAAKYADTYCLTGYGLISSASTPSISSYLQNKGYSIISTTGAGGTTKSYGVTKIENDGKWVLDSSKIATIAGTTLSNGKIMGLNEFGNITDITNNAIHMDTLTVSGTFETGALNLGTLKSAGLTITADTRSQLTNIPTIKTTGD